MTPPLQRWQIDRARADAAGARAGRRRCRRTCAIACACAGRRVVGAGVRGQPPPGRGGRRGARGPARGRRRRRAARPATRRSRRWPASTRASSPTTTSRPTPMPRCAWAPRAGPPSRVSRRPPTRPAHRHAAGQPGETCVLLVDGKHGADHPLARRCTYGTVWTASARANAGGTALTLAVQPLAAWRELWMFRATRRRLDAAGAAAVRPRPSASATSSSPAGCPARARCWRRARCATRARQPPGAQLRAARWPHAGHREDGRRAVVAEGVPPLPGSGVEARDGQSSLRQAVSRVFRTAAVPAAAPPTRRFPRVCRVAVLARPPCLPTGARR